MLLAHRTGRAEVIAAVARIVVVADLVFTASAVVVQPITGALLAWSIGYSLTDGWIAISLALYLLTGAFWLPVVWMQMRMRDLAAAAVRDGRDLPAEYHRLFRLWFAFGIPAFAAVLAIFWLMIVKPQFWLEPVFGRHAQHRRDKYARTRTPNRIIDESYLPAGSVCRSLGQPARLAPSRRWSANSPCSSNIRSGATYRG